MTQSELITNTIILIDGLTKGLYAGIGKDLWEKIKGVFKTDDEVKLLENYENNLLDDKLERDVINILKEKILSNELETELIKLLERKLVQNISIMNSKNVLSNSQINTGGGNFHIGDSYK
jgi:hypothetical protein